MSASAILVTFGQISQASADCNQVAATIQSDLDDLKKYLGPITSTWNGEAASNYQMLQARWNTAANDLNTVLHNISRALGVAHDNYTQAERVNASIWGAN